MYFNKIVKNNKGFSLVELMVVIAIIGVLSAIAIPSYKSYLIKTRTVEIMALGKSFQTAMNDYYTANGTMPKTTAAINRTDITGDAYSLTIRTDPYDANSGEIYIVINPGGYVGSPVQFVFTLTPFVKDGVIIWRCVGARGGSTTMYLPSNCQTCDMGQCGWYN
jgi:type IV pilus assembly protein PilA